MRSIKFLFVCQIIIALALSCKNENRPNKDLAVDQVTNELMKIPSKEVIFINKSKKSVPFVN
ncbi:MAG: hypothetical protein AAFY41_14630, partial [Bacteroidota bacterium]